MPFSASDASNSSVADLQELYTREPVTRIVDGAGTTPSTLPRRGSGNRRRRPPPQEQRPVYVHKMKTSTPPGASTTSGVPTSDNWKPFTDYESTPVAPSVRPQTLDFDLPEEMRETLGDFHFLTRPPSEKPIFVTLSAAVVTTPITPITPRQDIQRVLASIGLMPDHTPTAFKRKVTKTTTATAVPDMSVAAESLTPEMKDLLVSFGLMPDPNAPKKAMNQTKIVEPELVLPYKSVNPTIDPSSYSNFKPLPTSRIAEGHDNELNGEMKDFLASFGLISNSETKRRSQKSMSSERSATVEPEVDAVEEVTTEEFYSTTESTTEMMEEMTTTQSSSENMPNINMDILTDDMKETLQNLGLMEPENRISKKLNHVFNPASHTALLEQSDELVRINRLLDRIKELSENNKTQYLSNEQIKAILEEDALEMVFDESKKIEEDVTEEDETTTEAVTEEGIKTEESSPGENLFDGSNSIDSDQSVPMKSLQEVADPPDPLSLDELRQMLAADKNEFKRQKPAEPEEHSSEDDDMSTTESPSTEAPSNSTSTTSPSDSSASGSGVGDKPSEADLEASFPGPASSTPRSRRPNGLYFLVDWNSVLRVGDGSNGRMVDLTFNPKVGDPRNFVPDMGPIV